YFDAIVSVDSFIYYGTDDMYLNYLARFVKPGGPVGIAGAALAGELGEDGSVPAHLCEWWAQDQPWSFHTAAWGRSRWGRTGILDREVADTMPDGWRFWLDWLRLVAPANATEIRALETDAGRYLGYVRAVGRRRGEAQLWDPAITVPPQYEKKPLLRDSP